MTARQGLEAALGDVEELVQAHVALTGGGVGAPAQRQGQAISRAAIVILVAAIEVFVEELFEETALKFYEVNDRADLKFLFSNTTDKLNHPSVEKIDLLFYNIGIMNVLDEVRWKKTSNDSFKKRFRALLELRGRIAHGRRPSVRLSVVRRGLAFARRFADCLQSTVDWYVADEETK